MRQISLHLIQIIPVSFSILIARLWNTILIIPHHFWPGKIWPMIMAAVTTKCKRCSKTGSCTSSCQTNPANPSNSHSRRLLHELHQQMSNLKSKMHRPGSTTAASPPKLAATSLNYKPCPSMPQSNKRALVCGVSYNDKKGKFKLKGTINDVKIMRDLLINNFKFPKDHIRVLTEEEPAGSEFIPTKVNIQNSLKWLVDGCKSGDSLVFYYSGHGLRQPDFEGDEIDGFDETICPLDFIKEGMIDDNYINSTIVKPLKKGVTLHAIIDACHSGTVLDLSHVYDPKKKKWEDNFPPSGVKKDTNGLVICISACKDDQVAADTSAFTGNTMYGALTYVLFELVKKFPGLTYGDLIDLMEEKINASNQEGCLTNTKIVKRMFQDKSLKVPQLSSSEEFDVYKKHFKM